MCDPEVVPAPLRLAPAREALPSAALPDAVLALVAAVDSGLGRERIVEALRGRRSREVLRLRLDGLPAFGTCGHATATQVRAAVEALVADGRLERSSGVFPVLRLPGAERLAA